jgi:hypothetical protein
MQRRRLRPPGSGGASTAKEMPSLRLCGWHPRITSWKPAIDGNRRTAACLITLQQRIERLAQA